MRTVAVMRVAFCTYSSPLLADSVSDPWLRIIQCSERGPDLACCPVGPARCFLVSVRYSNLVPRTASLQRKYTDTERDCMPGTTCHQGLNNQATQGVETVTLGERVFISTLAAGN